MCIVLEHETPIIQEPSGVEMSVENYSPFLSLLNVKNKLEQFEAVTGDDDSSYDGPGIDDEDEDLDWDADDFADIDLDEDDDYWSNAGDWDEDGNELDEDGNIRTDEDDDENEEVIPDVDADLHLTDHEGTDEPIF